MRAGMRVRAHLQAIEGDEVDLNAEAWARTRIPARLRGGLGCLRRAIPNPPSHTRATRTSALATNPAMNGSKHEATSRSVASRPP